MTESQLVDQEFEYQCPDCGHTGRLFQWTSATPGEWIAARKRNPHRRVCRGCGNGYGVSQYIWRYIGPHKQDKEASGE